MSKNNYNLAALISLNSVKDISQDKIIDLLYSEKYNGIFKKNETLARMFPKTPNLAVDSDLGDRWEQSLIEGILPNTFSTLSYQSVRLKITPFDENLSLKQDNAVEVNSYFVQDLELSLDTYGFSGYIDFIYPYQTEYDNKLMDLFTSGLPLQLEITIKQKFLIEDDEKEFIEKNGDSSNDDIKIIAYTGNSQIKQTQLSDIKFGGKDVGLIKFNGLYKIEFCDSMSFFWQQLNPVSIYSNQSYEKIIQEQNTPFDKLLKLTFDESCNDTLRQELAFVCVNCQGDEYNFYKYVLYILQQYNLLIIYNYKNGNYTITSDYKGLISKSKPIKSMLEGDKKKIQKIRQIHEKPYLIKKSLMNVDFNNSDEQDIKATEMKNPPKTINTFKHIKTTQHDINKLFKLRVDNNNDKFQNTFATKSTRLDIKSDSLPCSYSIYPLQNNFNFSAKEWGLILGKKDQNIVLHRTKLKIQKTPLYSKNNQRHPLAYERKQKGKVVNHTITFKFEDTALSNSELPLMFNCNLDFDFYNQDIWPKAKDTQRPPSLYVGGIIFATKQDSDDSSSTSYLFDCSPKSSKTTVANESYSSSDTVSNLDPNATSRPRYQIKVSPQLWTGLTPKSMQFIPADMFLASYSNMLFYLKSGTEVELSLLEEYANITKIKNYLAPNEMFSKGDKEQQQGIIFENRKEQSTIIKNVYKPSDKTGSFKIVHEPAEGTPSNLEMNNQSFKISVDCKK